MTLITICKVNVRTLNVHCNTIQPFGKNRTFQHFYKSAYSIRRAHLVLDEFEQVRAKVGERE